MHRYIKILYLKIFQEMVDSVLKPVWSKTNFINQKQLVNSSGYIKDQHQWYDF